MNPALTFILLLISLFLLSRVLTSSLLMLLFRLTRSKRLAIGIFSFLFLPGTVIHEFSHAATAQILGVYVGEMNLTPKIGEKDIQLGSVQIAESDPFRHFLIGVAPLIVGLFLIILNITIYSRLGLTGFLPAAVLFYILFQIGNTMFSSSRDMEGAIELGIAVGLILGVVYFVWGTQPFINALSQLKHLDPFFKMATNSLVKIITVDIGIIILARILNSPLKISK
ncbi:MAG: hypothetical protein NUV69_02050 [Candidatus Curtissbacteria bacterium]|nr:hypothetical protein [Candidatus Curtissbacteria bacterium]